MTSSEQERDSTIRQCCAPKRKRASLSQIQVVYGSFATTVAVLLSVEIAAIVLLLGAQVIANYERLERTRSATVKTVPQLRTD